MLCVPSCPLCHYLNCASWKSRVIQMIIQSNHSRRLHTKMVFRSFHVIEHGPSRRDVTYFLALRIPNQILMMIASVTASTWIIIMYQLFTRSHWWEIHVKKCQTHASDIPLTVHGCDIRGHPFCCAKEF